MFEELVLEDDQDVAANWKKIQIETSQNERKANEARTPERDASHSSFQLVVYYLLFNSLL